MAKAHPKNNYWLIESNNYMKVFHQRLEGRFEDKLKKLIENCLKSKNEAPYLKLWTCFQDSSFVGNEITLLLAQLYHNEKWSEYLAYRYLLDAVYIKVFEWVLMAEKLQKDGVATEALSLGLINQVVLPLQLGAAKTESLPVFQSLLNNPVGTSTGFRPDLTETFKQMVDHKLSNTPLPVIDRFEASTVYEYLAWRYKYCIKPSNEVDFALALMPEELIAYHLMRRTNVDKSLLEDPQFVRMQAALDTIRNGNPAPLQPQLLIDALNHVSELEQQAYREIGEETTPLNKILAIQPS